MRVSIDTRVLAPARLEIPLTRADWVSHSSIFRLCFDVSLALSMMLLGSSLNTCVPVPLIHWIFFLVCAIAAACFLGMSQHWMSKATGKHRWTARRAYASIK